MKIHIMLLCTLSLCSCVEPNNEPDSYMIPEARKYLYDDGDQLIYKSDSGLLDTFGIKSWYASDDVCNTDVQDIVWKEICWTEEYFYLYIYHLKDSSGYVYPNLVKCDNSFFCINYRAYREEYDSDEKFEYSFGIRNKGAWFYPDFTEVLVINDVSYSVSVKTTSNISDPPINKIYFNTNYGVLRYEMDDGDWWELQIEL